MAKLLSGKLSCMQIGLVLKRTTFVTSMDNKALLKWGLLLFRKDIAARHRTLMLHPWNQYKASEAFI